MRNEVVTTVEINVCHAAVSPGEFDASLGRVGVGVGVGVGARDGDAEGDGGGLGMRDACRKMTKICPVKVASMNWIHFCNKYGSNFMSYYPHYVDRNPTLLYFEKTIRYSFECSFRLCLSPKATSAKNICFTNMFISRAPRGSET